MGSRIPFFEEVCNDDVVGSINNTLLKHMKDNPDVVNTVAAILLAECSYHNFMSINNNGEYNEKA